LLIQASLIIDKLKGPSVSRAIGGQISDVDIFTSLPPHKSVYFLFDLRLQALYSLNVFVFFALSLPFFSGSNEFDTVTVERPGD